MVTRLRDKDIIHYKYYIHQHNINVCDESRIGINVCEAPIDDVYANKLRFENWTFRGKNCPECIRRLKMNEIVDTLECEITSD